jgi:hypothetical protein
MIFLSEGVNLVGNASRFGGGEIGVSEGTTKADAPSCFASHELGGTTAAAVVKDGGGGCCFKDAASTPLPNFRISSFDKPAAQCFAVFAGLSPFPFFGDGTGCDCVGTGAGLVFLDGGSSVGRVSTSMISMTSLFRFKVSALIFAEEALSGCFSGDVVDCDCLSGNSVSFQTEILLLLIKDSKKSRQSRTGTYHSITSPSSLKNTFVLFKPNLASSLVFSFAKSRRFSL